MAEMLNRFSKKHKLAILSVFFAFAAILLGIISFMAYKNYTDSMHILEESINARMLSMAMAAREMIGSEKVASYNSYDDIVNDPEYPAELAKLRRLAGEIGAKYLYILKSVEGKYYFIYDTDPVNEILFDEYELTDIHSQAFRGKPAASAYDVQDAYGSFSTGAVPIYHAGKLVGIAAADIEDEFIEQNREAQFWNIIFLIVTITVTLIIMAAMLAILLKKIKTMQDRLFRQAHYDKLTNLPNRQYLLEHLASVTEKGGQSFALFFIDLDNFKSVNDTAGHDAGDELLKNIGEYLSSAHVSTKVFRPTAGALNVAARIGGDEFILVAPSVTAQDAELFAQEMLAGLHTNVPDKNIEKFSVGFSIGIAMYPEHSTNYHVLIKYADIAMYHSKNAGKNQYRLYNQEMKGKEEK